MKWLGPSTLEEIEAAGAEGLGVVVDPIAFVSEHVETLVELDRDYAAARRARQGCSAYIRAPALGVAAALHRGLAGLVERGAGRRGERGARVGALPARRLVEMSRCRAEARGVIAPGVLTTCCAACTSSR